VAATLFWWVGDFAGVVGRGLAYQIAGNIERLQGVVVYSPPTYRSPRREFRRAGWTARRPRTNSATRDCACWSAPTA